MPHAYVLPALALRVPHGHDTPTYMYRVSLKVVTGGYVDSQSSLTVLSLAV